MRKTTKKDIRSYVTSGIAMDITNASTDWINALRIKEGGLSGIVYSCGVYGINGLVVEGRTSGNWYAVIGRCSNLLMIL